MKYLSVITGLIRGTFNRMWEFNIGLHGAAIAFYAIFSTAPLAIILIWVMSIILGQQLGQTEFQQAIQSILGPELTQSITGVVTSTPKGETGFWSSIIAIVTLIFGATTLLTQIKHSLNEIWGLKKPKIGSVWHYLWNRLVALLFIGSLSILFFIGLVSESLIYGLEYIFIPIIGTENVALFQIGSSLTNVLLAFCFFTVMFKMLPDINVRWRDIAIGSIVTTILVLTGKALVDWYLGAVALQPVYKAAGSFVIFLIWMYYNVQVVLIGAIFTQVFTSRYGGKVQPFWDAALSDQLYKDDRK